MAALRLPLADVRSLLDQQTTTRVELACINSANQVTLAGTHEDLSSFHEEVLKIHPAARWQLIENMRAAFHSRFVEPIREEFLAACRSVEFRPSKISVLSGPLGRTCPPGDDALNRPDYLVKHCIETNCFGEAVREYTSQNEMVAVDQPDWIELGSHSSTIGFIPVTKGQLKLPSQRKGSDGWATTLDTFIKLRVAGHTVDFRAFHRDINPAARHIDLPRYPFQLQAHSYPVRRVNQSSPGLVKATVYPRVTSAELSPILKSHVVANTPICPASVYMSLVLAASCDKCTERPAFRISQLEMFTPFTGSNDDWLQVRKAAPLCFEVVSKGGQVHASMQVEMYHPSRLLESLSLLKPLVSFMRSIRTQPSTSILDTRLAYNLFGQTVSYGPHCQGLRRVWIAEDGHHAWALSSNEPHESEHRIKLEPAGLQPFSPVLIDRACQLIGLLVNTSPDRRQDEIFVASGIDQVEMVLSNIRDSVAFESYASFELTGGNGTDGATAVGQVFTFDQDQRLVAVFRSVRMRRMKQRIVEHIVRREAAEPVSIEHRDPVKTMAKPLLTPKKQVDQSGNDELCRNISSVFQTTLGIDHIPADRKVGFCKFFAVNNTLTYILS
jgi:acyl transferase domain-containing protein